MKTLLKIVLALVVLIFASLIVIPMVFKEDIVKLVKEESNKALNAEVNFGEFGLSLISSFPDFYFSIEEVSVKGLGEFEGLELAYIQELDLTVDLMSVINGESIRVKNIRLLSPKIHAKVLPEGDANWDIAKESDEAVEEEIVEESGSFKMQLERFDIQNASIRYEDPSMPVDLHIQDLNLVLSGDLTETLTTIQADGSIAAFDLYFDGIHYMKEVKIALNAGIQADLDQFKFTFNENEILVNELPLGFDGWVAMPNDPIDMDFTFEAKKSDFKEILSLIPAAFAKDLEGVETSGVFALSGYAKGTFIDSTYPAFGINMQVDDARFNYPDLPKSVEDIQIRASVESKDGDLDHTVVDVPTFHLSLADNPFDLNFYLATPMSDPFIRAGMNGVLVLDNIKDVVPLESGDELAGTINAQIKLEGKASTLEAEKYEEFKANGSLDIKNLHYASDSLDYPVDLKTAVLKFNPKSLDLTEMNMQLGKSDLSAQGQLRNFIGYAMKEGQVLSGTLNVQSNLLDINELAGIDPSEEEANIEEASETETTEEASEGAVLLPKYIDFVCKADLKQLIFDNIQITAIQGGINLSNEKLSLSQTNMNLLGGAMKMSGYYETSDSTKPTYDFSMAIKSFDVDKTVSTFNSVKTMVPIAGNSHGNYSTQLLVKGDLTANMDPVFESMNGSGTLNTENIEIRDYEPILKIGKAIKYEKLNPMDMTDIDITYTITNGKIYVNPFEYEFGGSKVVISGSNSFDQTIDYTFAFAIPREELGGEANKVAEDLLGQIAGKGLDLKLPDVINIDVQMKGNATDPKISTAFRKGSGGSSSKSASDQAKDQAKEILDAKKKEAEAKAKEELEKQKKKAEEEAKKELEKQKKKAEEELKKQQEDAKKKLEEEAKKKLKGLFGK